MKKGNYIIERCSNKIYIIVGRLFGDIILVDTDENSEEIIAFGAEKLERCISEGKFRKLHKTGIKIKNEGL